MREITVSYSELMAARRCLRKHDLSYRHAWTRENSPTSALSFGTAWHAVLNAYYLELRDTNQWSVSSSPWRSAKAVIALQHPDLHEPLEWVLTGYSAAYGLEPGWTVVNVEHALTVPLPQLRPDLRINLKVKIDLILRDPNGMPWVDDHKTCARLPTLKKTPTDPQLPLYMWAYGKSYPSVFPHGARYSYALKPPKVKRDYELDQRFRRRCISHSAEEISAIVSDAYATMYLAYTGYEQTGWTPRSRSPDCSWCEFDDPCRASLKGYDLNQFLRDQSFSQWREEPKAPKELPHEA